jgi:hypothetical protein
MIFYWINKLKTVVTHKVIGNRLSIEIIRSSLKLEEDSVHHSDMILHNMMICDAMGIPGFLLSGMS